ncbi:hypothetical protein GCM10011344_34980 [Dokdonia pacifica]|uniref:Uncharacterized protein n=1 Tax=Dokdonia pacifica TaxID=1627892 RepID=A0A239ANY6_9FLAO|nr:hypothetical protein [Dokdonia pacifica]GGG31077.1 hypothetical protein GCM10011344_34980 [Dokdonia pacifica]SNR97375.1 hypothetical protein SAMN06265376_10544 [Dokdonia pacifica]
MKNIVLALCILTSGHLLSQHDKLNFLDWQLRKGDIGALTEIATYFDSKKEVITHLGYHIIHTDESSEAKRILNENTMFLDTEIRIDTTTTARQFQDFLNKNRDKITFSTLADAFIMTPFEERETKYEITGLTRFKSNELEKKRAELLRLDWVIDHKIDKLIAAKNPQALLKIASLFVKSRYRFNEYKDTHEEMIDLIRLLTNTNISVPNIYNELSFHLENEFYTPSKINLLTFFVNHYKEYTWDDTSQTFKNTMLDIKFIAPEENLFEELQNENDTIALNAFTTLSQLNALKAQPLIDKYSNSGVSNNYELPTFEYRFLKQLVLLTDYCDAKKIDYKGSTQLRDQIALLKTNLTFKERHQLENNIIENLTLEDITAFEYWSLIDEKSWGLTYSAGRILDVFYSRNWQQLINNPTYLETYLLKSKLFDDLGIIGFCNSYLVKFTGASDDITSTLQAFSSSYPKVQSQLKKAKEIALKPLVFKEKEKKDWTGISSKKVADFQKEFKKIKLANNDSTKYEEDIVSLLSKIKYSQIGEALQAIENIPFKYEYSKYSFMNRDFGFSYIKSFSDQKNREEFLKKYTELTEIQLHTHYAKQAGIDFMTSNNVLDYDKIYDILKFNINNAFVGGGGSTKDNGAYSIIKILELTFTTRLGYPHKLCSSDNMYGCDSRGRATAWMHYLETNGLLKKKHKDPVSFAYE